MKLFDSCIIGGGPAGITAAMYLARSGCSVCMIEEMALGGQILQTAELENYPGFPKGIKGYELADTLAAHLDNLELVRKQATVSSIQGTAGNFVLDLSSDNEPVAAKTIIVCTGAKHRQLGVAGESELIGRGVSYCAICDGNFFRGRDVAVVGGGNAALEESLYLSNIVNKVHLIHRRDSFRGRQVFQDRILARSDKIVLHKSTTIVSLHTSAQGLSGLRLRDVVSGAESDLDVQGLFVYVGYQPVTSFLPPEIEKDAAGFLVTDTEMRASVPGIFAAGDIRSKNCRQVITAAGDGATAAQSVFLFLEQFHA